tara:strand:- start:986 stop:1171 length:186 start_codon:yes stop_codon:yes gene_type:complete
MFLISIFIFIKKNPAKLGKKPFLAVFLERSQFKLNQRGLLVLKTVSFVNLGSNYFATKLHI